MLRLKISPLCSAQFSLEEFLSLSLFLLFGAGDCIQNEGSPTEQAAAGSDSLRLALCLVTVGPTPLLYPEAGIYVSLL